MEFSEYQRDASLSAIYPRVGANAIYPILLLTEEVGELVSIFSKSMRDRPSDWYHSKKPSHYSPSLTREDSARIRKEAGDVLWALSALLSETHISLEDVASDNLQKLKSRKSRGKLGGSGDDR